MLIPKVDPANQSSAHPEDQPPSYDVSTEGQTPPVVSDVKQREQEPEPISTPSASSSSASIPPALNYVYISKASSIKGTWTIDPTLMIPEPMLSSLPEGETERPNLFFNGYNGSISADIHLIAREPDVMAPFSKIKVNSLNGSVQIKIHRTSERPQFSMYLSSWNGSVTVHLPQNFHGPVYYKTLNGSTKFANSMGSKVTIFSEEPRKISRAFIGDWQSSGFGDTSNGPWTGDEIHVEVKNGGISFKWADIPDEDVTRIKKSSDGGGGWLSKWFGGGSGGSSSEGPPKDESGGHQKDKKGPPPSADPPKYPPT
jgi:hypothetical protein